MSRIPIVLADQVTASALATWRMSDAAMRERILIFGAIGVVILLVLIWAIFLRKSRRPRHGHRRWHYHSPEPAPVAPGASDEAAAPSPERRRRRRRSSRKHRPRNPTLAETGGLPPIRPEGPPEPQA